MGLLLFLLCIFISLPFLQLAYTQGSVWLTQRAADTAALAGAGAGAEVISETDAFGDVYCESVVIQQAPAAQAASAYWQGNTTQGVGGSFAAPMPALQTPSFQTHASGSTFTVTAGVRVPPGAMALVGVNPVGWTVASKAAVLQPPGANPCP